MRRTLRSSVAAGCVPPHDSWLTGHRDDRDPRCPRCGSGLHRSRMAGRGTMTRPALVGRHSAAGRLRGPAAGTSRRLSRRESGRPAPRPGCRRP
jgi:hypothetical protein